MSESRFIGISFPNQKLSDEQSKRKDSCNSGEVENAERETMNRNKAVANDRNER